MFIEGLQRTGRWYSDAVEGETDPHLLRHGPKPPVGVNPMPRRKEAVPWSTRGQPYLLDFLPGNYRATREKMPSPIPILFTKMLI